MKKLKLVTLIGVAFSVSGCASANIYSENGLEKVSAIGVTCSKPIVFTKDCSNVSGATKAIKIENYKMKIASTGDDKTILVMDSSPLINSFKSGLTLGIKDYNSESSKDGFEAIKRLLSTKNIEVTRVVIMESAGSVFGYIVELSEPGYEVLKQNGQ